MFHLGHTFAGTLSRSLVKRSSLSRIAVYQLTEREHVLNIRGQITQYDLSFRFHVVNPLMVEFHWRWVAAY